MKNVYLLSFLFFFNSFIRAADTLIIDMDFAVILAIQNSPKLKNAELYKKSARQIERFEQAETEFNYRGGQLISPGKGWQLEVKQDINPLFSTFLKNKVKDYAVKVEDDKATLLKKMFETKIKSSFLYWVYLQNKLEILNTKKEYVGKTLEVATLKTELGELEPLEKMIAFSKAAEIETECSLCQYDIEIVENELKGMLNIDSHIQPKQKPLEIYMIDKSFDTSSYTGNCYTDILFDKFKYTQALVRDSRNSYFPDLKIGFFIQNIDNSGALTGISAGISVPVWHLSSKTKLKKLRIDTEIAYNLYTESKNNISQEIKNLILKLDKTFIKIRYFQNNAMPAADMIIKTSVSKYRNEEIEFSEYIKKINGALNTRLEYIKTINEYNQIALDLELYSN